MQILSIFYDNATKYVLDYLKDYRNKYIFIEYDFTYKKDRTKGRKEMGKYSARELPFVLLEDENLNYIKAIWTEETKKQNFQEELNRMLQLA